MKVGAGWSTAGKPKSTPSSKVVRGVATQQAYLVRRNKDVDIEG